MKKQSISYRELMSGKTDRAKIEQLAEAGMLTDGTLSRIGHMARFCERLGNEMMPHPTLKVSEVFTEDDLQRFWTETADPNADVGRCPLLH